MNESVIKCVVWDLDDTIWTGILLEDGDVMLKPRISDVLETLDNRGILNSIASRNDFDAAKGKLEEFGIDHFFLFPQINWNAKSFSIEKIREKVNIGYDAMMFIDDQPFEREEVSSVHREVWCVDSGRYLDIAEHPRLKPSYVTGDSRMRRLMILDDLVRQAEEEESALPRQEFLRGLGMNLDVSDAGEDDLLRAEELTYRTNQLNATGERYSVEDLKKLRLSDRHKILICELEDRFGKYGKIGLAVIELSPGGWLLKLLLFSCRVMSRGVGTVLLTLLRSEARNRKVKLEAEFRHTGRNRMMYVAYKFAGFREAAELGDGKMLLDNDLSEIPPLPDHMNIVTNVRWS